MGYSLDIKGKMLEYYAEQSGETDRVDSRLLLAICWGLLPGAGLPDNLPASCNGLPRGKRLKIRDAILHPVEAGIKPV